MKQSNNQVGEKVLVLGAGQLGASVLASLVPAVTQRNGSVCVIVSGRSRINRANDVPAFINNWRMPVRGLSRSTSQTVRLQR